MTSSNPPFLLQAHLHLSSEAQTNEVAMAIAHYLEHQPNLRIYLLGDLGAGKTTFVRLLLRQLGVEGRIKSPTFALVETYELASIQSSCHHFDLYRLEAPQEWVESGLQEDLLSAGIKLVEWPNKADGYLPPPDLTLALRIEHTASAVNQPKSPVACATQTETDEDCSTPKARSLTLSAFSATGLNVAEHILKVMQ